MISLLLSVAIGTGVYLLFEGITNPQPASRSTRRLQRVEDYLARAGLQGVSLQELSLFSLGTGLLLGILLQVLLGWALVSLLGVALGFLLPFAYFTQRAERRRARIQIALAEAMGQLRDSIRTGLSVQEAFGALARTGPEVLRAELETLQREARFLGFEPALVALRERLADPLFDVIAASLLLNDRFGGRNVSQMFDRLAAATQAQLRVQDELRAYRARTVLSARIIAAVPLVVLAGIRQLNPEYLALFNDWPGQLVLAACLGSIGVGYAAMRWLTRLPAERRVLR